MNIAIGKFGRSMYFDESSWSIYAGDDSPKIVYLELARKHPNDTFYILGASDFTKWKERNTGFFAEEAVPENIVDVWNSAKAEIGAKYNFGKKGYTEEMMYKIEGKEPWRMLDEYVETHGLKFDLGIFMQGPDARVSVMGEGIPCKNKKGSFSQCLMMAALYNGPMRHLINKLKFPWYNIIEDPRYVPIQDVDVIHHEEFNLSQCNAEYQQSCMDSYTQDPDTYEKKPFILKYYKTERWFLRNLKKVDFTNPKAIKVGKKTYEKNIPFILTLNGGYDRLEFLENWVLNKLPNCKVYGKWDDAAQEKHPDTFIKKGIVEIQDKMWQSMFTFVPSFMKSRKNFVTQKVWKMMYYGIIPFWDKNTYDTDNLFSDLPDFFKVENPDEMWKRIRFLMENPDEYKKCLKIMYDLLEDKYFNGDFIDEVFNPLIEKRRAELKEDK